VILESRFGTPGRNWRLGFGLGCRLPPAAAEVGGGTFQNSLAFSLPLQRILSLAFSYFQIFVFCFVSLSLTPPASFLSLFSISVFPSLFCCVNSRHSLLPLSLYRFMSLFTVFVYSILYRCVNNRQSLLPLSLLRFLISNLLLFSVLHDF